MKTTLRLLALLTLLFPKQTFSQSYEWVVNGGGNSGDYGNAIAVDPAGHSYVTGWFQNTATFGGISITSAGQYDIFIAKYDPAGQIIWLKKAGGSGTDIGYGIDLDANGNIYIAGTFQGVAAFGGITVTSSAGSPDIFVARYDPAGNPLWVQQAGSATDDQAQAIAVDKASSKIYISGYFKTTANFGSIPVTSSGNSDVFIAKYDTIAAMNSTPLWIQTGGGTSYDNCYSVCTDASGNAYITGDIAGTATFGTQTVTSAGDDDVFIAKYNTQGTIQFAHRYGGTGLDRGLKIASRNNIIGYTGWFNGNATFGSTTLISAGLDEIFVAAIDTSGNSLWANKAGGAGYDQGYGICTDVPGNIYVTGSFDSVAQFNTVTVTSAGAWDVFIAKYSSAGVFQWVMSGGSPATNTFDRDIGYGIQPDAMQNLYVTGIIRNTAAFGPYSVTSFGIQDVFVAKISQATAVEEIFSPADISVFPNPSHGIFTIHSANVKANYVQVFNSFGQHVFSYSFRNKKNLDVDLRPLAKGMYYIRLIAENKIYYEKILIQ
ncbi:MAG TPA: SBBP repeat-containing protein [Bacteroidia bacterium]|nr:SBBP repeat-containing protein [Bacteroidia bacterium]